MAELTPAPGGYPIKLVRDNTPEIINFTDEPGDLWYAPAPPDVLKHYLRLKLSEEVAEYLVGGGEEELADVLAVLRGLEACLEINLEEMVAADGRGGFLSGMMMYGRHEEFDGRACEVRFEFGNLPCEREHGHPGPHYARCGGPTWFNDQGKRVEGGSTEDYA